MSPALGKKKQNIGVYIHDLGIDKGFLEHKAHWSQNIHKLYFRKTKNVCSSKDIYKEILNTNHRLRENICNLDIRQKAHI